MVLTADIAPVFKEQVFGAFEDLLMLGTRFSVFAATDLIDNAAKVGHDVKRIEYDLGQWQFFLTALMNGSHISMATASMLARWRWLNWLKNRSKVAAFRSLPTNRTRPLRKSSTTVR